jgi:polyhydroxybutyrate depolymerase
MLSKYHLIQEKSMSLSVLKALVLALIFALPAAVGAAPTSNGGLQDRPFTHNGYDRPYLIYRPADLPTRPAVVFMLGGIRSTPQYVAKNFNWTELADRYKFLVVYPYPVRTNTTKPKNRLKNITFWEMRGSRTHILAPGAKPLDDDGYLLAVMQDVFRRDHPDPQRVFFAGFSSGSGMVQLFAARHSDIVSGIVAVATPLMDPPVKLAWPVPVLYIHGDKDEQLSGFEAHSPHFATTPHGNWVTWGYLNGCQKQTAERTDWGVRFSWEGCKDNVPVVADFVKNLGHEWAGTRDSHWNQEFRPNDPLNFTAMAWKFFASIHRR